MIVYTPAEQALLDAPLPSPHLPNRLARCFRVRPRPEDAPWGSRRIPDPQREAEVARIFSLRLTYEEDGYIFPEHPRPKVPASCAASTPTGRPRTTRGGRRRRPKSGRSLRRLRASPTPVRLRTSRPRRTRPP